MDRKSWYKLWCHRVRKRALGCQDHYRLHHGEDYGDSSSHATSAAIKNNGTQDP